MVKQNTQESLVKILSGVETIRKAEHVKMFRMSNLVRLEKVVLMIHLLRSIVGKYITDTITRQGIQSENSHQIIKNRTLLMTHLRTLRFLQIRRKCENYFTVIFFN